MGEVPLYTFYNVEAPKGTACAWFESFRTRRKVQGYLTYTETHPPRTLPEAYAEGRMVVLGRGAVSYARGTPVLNLWPFLSRASRVRQVGHVLFVTLACQP